MRDDEITPAGVLVEGFRWLPVLIVTTAVLTALGLLLTLVMWLTGNWFATQNVSNSYRRTVNSQAYQATLIDQMNAALQNITDTGTLRTGEPEGSPLQASQRAQQLGYLRTFCAKGAQLTPGNPAAAQLQPVYDANCTAGTVNTSPPLVPPAN